MNNPEAACNDFGMSVSNTFVYTGILYTQAEKICFQMNLKCISRQCLVINGFVPGKKELVIIKIYMSYYITVKLAYCNEKPIP